MRRPLSDEQKKNPLVGPSTVEENVSKVTGEIRWYDSLDEAKAEARRTGKRALSNTGGDSGA